MIQADEEKKKKKVNNELLMLEFMAKKAKQTEKGKKDESNGKSANTAPMLPGQKKR